MFTIGKVRLKNQLILAPMAGITNLAFRKICHDLGAGLVCSEMISANAIAHGSKKTIELYLMTDRSENPVSFQLFGSDPKNIKIATEAITNTNCDIIDINMGCPVRKITSINSGAMLMRDQKNAQNVIKAVIDNTSKPVTVKIRSGWAKDKCLTYLKIGKIAEDLGCSAVTLHAKTAEQGYSGKADWSLIKKLKESLNIPVIGNGELWCPTEIKN
ncbi:MAG: tRNA-dihydrouridine synthase family protein, partial [Candidatus Aenigmarchaeota archaeon]|nr:tRNA-dihydrouridine synthase family protein [Candidatus Aenigmarchaeota archaeon]